MKFILGVFCYLLFSIVQLSANGQSSSGYTFRSSSLASFSSIASVGTLITPLPNSNSGSATVSLPWDFTFNGTTFNSVNISTNGFIGFQGIINPNGYFPYLHSFHTSGVGGDIDFTGIAILSTDLTKNPENSVGNIYTKYDNVNERFIIEWNNWNVSGLTGQFSMQLSLYKNNKITFLYDHPTIALQEKYFAIGLIFPCDVVNNPFNSIGVKKLAYDASDNSANFTSNIYQTDETSIPTTTNQYLFYEFTQPTPTISISAPLATLTSCLGSASTFTTLNITGTALTASVTISAPTDFEISTNSTTNYTSSLTLTNTSTLSNTIYIRLTAAASEGSKTGTISASSRGVVDDVTTTVNGSVYTIPTVSITEMDVSGTANNDNTVCNGGLATLTANGASAYLWSTIETTATITPSTSTNTTYTVTGTTNGCTNTASFTIWVEVITPPTLSVGPVISLCTDATFLITNTTYMPVDNGWTVSDGAITYNNGYLTSSTPGTYTLTYTDGCAQSVSTSVEVTSTSSLPAFTDGQASYKFDGTPKGPSNASYYIGYNGFNYFSQDKPTKTGFYKANNQVGDSAGCPFKFNIFRCTTCSN